MNWIPTGYKILVTGFSGLIGSTLVSTVSRDKIIGISRGRIKFVRKVLNNLELFRLDLSNSSENKIEKIVKRSGCDLILHIAALTGDQCQFNIVEAEQLNWNATYKLSLICKKLKIPLGFCSTADVFPKYGGPFGEDDPAGVIYDDKTKILNIYSWTKYRAENSVIKLLFKEKLGFIFRLAYPYNFAYSNKPGTVVNCFNTLSKGGNWNVVNNMNMNPTDVNSIVNAINKLIIEEVWKTENPIFHIAQKEILTSTEVAQICIEELKKRGIKVNVNKQIRIVDSVKFFNTSPRQTPGGIRVNKIFNLGIKISSFRNEVRNFPLL